MSLESLATLDSCSPAKASNCPPTCCPTCCPTQALVHGATEFSMQRQPAHAPKCWRLLLHAFHLGKLPLAVCRFWALLLLTVGLNFFSFKVHGWHHVAAAERLRAIICFNHVSYLDGIVIGSIFAPCGVAKVKLQGCVWHVLRLTQWHTGFTLCARLAAEGSDRAVCMLLVALALCSGSLGPFCALWGGQVTHCVHFRTALASCRQPSSASGVCPSVSALLLTVFVPDMVAHWLRLCALHHGRGEHL